MEPGLTDILPDIQVCSSVFETLYKSQIIAGPGCHLLGQVVLPLSAQPA